MQDIGYSGNGRTKKPNMEWWGSPGFKSSELLTALGLQVQRKEAMTCRQKPQLPGGGQHLSETPQWGQSQGAEPWLPETLLKADALASLLQIHQTPTGWTQGEANWHRSLETTVFRDLSLGNTGKSRRGVRNESGSKYPNNVVHTSPCLLFNKDYWGGGDPSKSTGIPLEHSFYGWLIIHVTILLSIHVLRLLSGNNTTSATIIVSIVQANGYEATL